MKSEIMGLSIDYFSFTDKGDEKSSFFVVNRLLFYDNIPEIVYINTINCPRHDFKPFFVCNMSFKFLNTMIPRSNTRCCACVRFEQASHTRKTVQPLS